MYHQVPGVAARYNRLLTDIDLYLGSDIQRLLTRVTLVIEDSLLGLIRAAFTEFSAYMAECTAARGKTHSDYPSLAVCNQQSAYIRMISNHCSTNPVRSCTI